MARRIRSIKPDFFTSPDVTENEFRTRLTWIGLWTYCDDFGREAADIDLIKAAIWPKDRKVQAKHIAADLEVFGVRNMIAFYTVGDRDYLQVINWRKHQRVDRPTKSNVPEPSGILRERLARESRELHLDSGGEGKGKEGIGGGGVKDAEPPGFCSNHPGGTSSNCRDCADARRANETWLRMQKNRPTPIPPRADDFSECAPGSHKWTTDGTCAVCPAHREANES